MTQFAIICRDVADSAPLRKANREDHLAFLKSSENLVLAGPFIRDGAFCGSLLILEADDIDAARAWAAQDPYAKGGVFESVEVIEFKTVVG
jgi:uncharacterized protein YciI